MTEEAHDLDSAGRWRRKYLIAAMVAWSFVDVFDGLFVPEEAREHWLEAAFWALATVVYVPFAWRRLLPPKRRLIDAVIVSCGIVFAAMSVLRATLPDAIAFRWAMALFAALCLFAVVLIRRRSRAEIQSPA